MQAVLLGVAKTAGHGGENGSVVGEHGDGSTIGILLAADRDEVAVQYALRGLATPLAISTYTTQRFITR